ncbi:MAG TPA: patatin-like phospholipase family protein [Candidatus Saccharimonadales bacterium]|nr:patatin-like phospholipase family protein [Candidatus Saccharimonadales bacterium]
MTTAFVLSGGGSLGAVQVGMLGALAKKGVVPDLIVGSSVGAINGAWFAGCPEPACVDQLADIWISLGRGDIFPLHPLGGLLGFLGRRNHLVAADGLSRLIRHHLPYERIEDARIPLHIVATEVTTGREVLISKGQALPAILASAAIPGVFPPVRVGALELMDGGVVSNTPIAHAVERGATRVYVLPAGYPCAISKTPRSALGMVLQALTLLVEHQLLHEVARYEDVVELRVVPPVCPLAVAPADFRHSAELIERARVATTRWLASPQPDLNQRDLLRLHHHARIDPLRADAA